MRNLKRYFIAFACALISFVLVMEILFWVSKKSGLSGHDATAIQALKVGFEGYKKEYGKWPDAVLHSSTESDNLRTVGDLVTTIIGENDVQNPRKIRFLQAPEAKDDKAGLIKSNGAYRIVDTWGEPYYMIFDKNGDGNIPNPHVSSDTKTLNASIILYSSGPDKNPATWQDNIISW